MYKQWSKHGMIPCQQGQTCLQINGFLWIMWVIKSCSGLIVLWYVCMILYDYVYIYVYIYIYIHICIATRAWCANCYPWCSIVWLLKPNHSPSALPPVAVRFCAPGRCTWTYSESPQKVGQHLPQHLFKFIFARNGRVSVAFSTKRRQHLLMLGRWKMIMNQPQSFDPVRSGTS